MGLKKSLPCLLCKQSSTLTQADQHKRPAEELVEIFKVFCNYMGLDLDHRIRDEYSKNKLSLFPFCAPCTRTVCQLFECHRKKVRVLKQLSRLVVTMAALVLESESDMNGPPDLPKRPMPAANKRLAAQIMAFRKSVIQKYSPKVRLKASPSKPESRVVFQEDRPVNDKQLLDPATGFEDPAELLEMSRASPDICSTRGYSERGIDKPKRRKVKLEQIENDNMTDFVDDPMDLDFDYGTEGDAGQLSDSDDSMSDQSDSSSDLGKNRASIKRESNKLVVSRKGEKKRARMFCTQLDENTFCLQNYNYKIVGSEFICETCSFSAGSVIKMRAHLRLNHIYNLPAIPEKPLEDYQVKENSYLLVEKYGFERVEDNEFRCSTCEHTASCWSRMYVHIREAHFGPSRSSRDSIAFSRRKVAVTQLGNNEYGYLGHTYSVLPHGSTKCGTCGVFRSNPSHIHDHIRKKHADFLSRIPDKLPQDYEVIPNLFCLSRKYIFEKTGEDSFHCAVFECNSVTATWESMYAHIWADHYYLLERSHKLRPSRILKKAARLQSKTTSVQEEPGDNNNDLEQSWLQDTLGDSAVATQESSSIECEAEEPQQSSAAPMTTPAAETEVLVPEILADLEISPGHYSYNDFEFRLVDGLYVCDSCDLTYDSHPQIFRHISRVHLNSKDFIKTGPNEFLFRGAYRGVREEDGRYRCVTDGCLSTASFPTVYNLKAHVFKIHVRAKPRAQCSEEAKEMAAEKLRTDQEKLIKASLAKFQVGPNQYSYMGTGFEFRDERFHCGACGNQQKLNILAHIRYKHADKDRVKQRRGGSRAARLLEDEDTTLRFEEIRPQEYLINGEFLACKLPDGKFKCGVGDCPSTLSTKSNLMTHIRLKHKVGSSVICELCGKVFKYQRILEIHIALMHEEGNGEVCPVCNKDCRNAFALKSHMRMHNKKGTGDERVHQCDSCGKSYKSPYSLNNHIALHHSGVKPTYPCNLCDRVYNWPESLTTHIKLNHVKQGKPSHPCPICHKEFKYSETIRRHILVVHEGKKSSEVYKRKNRASSSTEGVRGSSVSATGSKRKKTGGLVETQYSDDSAEEEEDPEAAVEGDDMDFESYITI